MRRMHAAASGAGALSLVSIDRLLVLIHAECRVRFAKLGLIAMLPAVLGAQTKPAAMDHDHMTMPATLSQHTKDQVAIAKRVAADLDSPEKARAAGYRPRFGDVPLQGEHWT